MYGYVPQYPLNTYKIKGETTFTMASPHIYKERTHYKKLFGENTKVSYGCTHCTTFSHNFVRVWHFSGRTFHHRNWRRMLLYVSICVQIQTAIFYVVNPTLFRHLVSLFTLYFKTCSCETCGAYKS